MRYQSICLALLAGIAACFAACGSDPIGNPGPVDLPFDLTIPDNRPVANYYAVSGIVTTRRLVKVNDSIVESSFPSFYAQFNAADSSFAIPSSVMLNGNPLVRNKGTSDTLRLDAVKDGSNLFGEDTWSLADSGVSTKTFPIKPVDIVDSVTPLGTSASIRSDTSLQIRWKRPSPGSLSGGMYLYWRAPGRTLSVNMNDGIGNYSMDTSALKTLRGRGSVTLIRYYNIPGTYNGKSLMVTRLAQRTYTITVD